MNKATAMPADYEEDAAMTFEVRIHDPKEPEKGLQNLGECSAPDLEAAEAFVNNETGVGVENIYLNRIA